VEAGNDKEGGHQKSSSLEKCLMTVGKGRPISDRTGDENWSCKIKANEQIGFIQRGNSQTKGCGSCGIWTPGCQVSKDKNFNQSKKGGMGARGGKGGGHAGTEKRGVMYLKFIKESA